MPKIRSKTNIELKRYQKLFSVLVKYGFEDIMVYSKITKLIPKSYLKKHPDTAKNIGLSTYERVRLVLEELGPTYVKLGQIFSNREDMLPPALIKELEKLQDSVPSMQNFNVFETIEAELGVEVKEHIKHLEKEPLAAASLAQVHKAQLNNEDWVVFKIQRPNIEEIIASDITVMKQIAGSLEKYSDQAKALQPLEIVAAFEKSIHEELDFLKEIEYTERFAANFKGNNNIYVPKVYRELSTKKLICMEYIDGIKVSNIEKLKLLDINCKSVAQKGVDLYLEQILEHGFFHADPHPGNLFVLPNTQQICFLDFGMMGTIMPTDKELLIDLLRYFLQNKVVKIVDVLQKIAIKTHIPNEKKLEYDLHNLIQEVNNTTLQNIKLGAVLTQFKGILFKNQITLPYYVYMLIRALIIIEGVGLKLDPDFNITENLKPYVSQIARKRFNFKRLLNKNLTRLEDINSLIDTLPENVDTILKKIKEGKLLVKHEHKGLTEFQNAITKASNRLVFAIIIAALSIGSALLVIADMPPKIKGIPVLGAIGFGLSAIMGFMVIFSIFKNKQL